MIAVIRSTKPSTSSSVASLSSPPILVSSRNSPPSRASFASFSLMSARSSSALVRIDFTNRLSGPGLLSSEASRTPIHLARKIAVFSLSEISTSSGPSSPSSSLILAISSLRISPRSVSPISSRIELVIWFRAASITPPGPPICSGRTGVSRTKYSTAVTTTFRSSVSQLRVVSFSTAVLASRS